MKRGLLMIPLALVIAIIVSALAVVRTKHENRALVAELETLRAERERLDMEWAQLQLEEATLANNNRVEHIAREQLGMTEPRDYQIVGQTAVQTPGGRP
ncbi:MAG: cell division protein FtsL [Solimonas sp.]